MNGRHKLCALMDVKQQWLDNLGINSPRYFTNEDRMDLLKLNYEVGEEVWNTIYEKVVKSYPEILSEMSPIVCPFCVLNTAETIEKQCYPCSYGKRHGMCPDTMDGHTSDYARICEKLNSFDDYHVRVSVVTCPRADLDALEIPQHNSQWLIDEVKRIHKDWGE